MFKTGLIGSAVTGVCCFTPVTAWGLGALGLSAWLAGADYVLLPLLVFFLGLAVIGLLRRRRG